MTQPCSPRALVILGILIGSSPAQTRLANGDGAETAWAAYEAGQDGRKDLIPELQAALRRLGKATEIDTHAVAAVLDALVLLGAKPGPEVIKPVVKACSRSHPLAQCLILMSRSPKVHEKQLVWVMNEYVSRPKQRPIWRACGNLLAPLRSKGLVDGAIKNLELTSVVEVRTELSKDSHRWSLSMGGWGRSHPPSIRIPKQYPPYGYYRLSYRKSGQILASGSRTIYYSRKGNSRMYQLPSTGTSENVTKAYLEWVAQCLKTTADKLPLKVVVREIHLWSDPAHYTKAVYQARAKARGSLDALMIRLIHAKLVTKTQRFSQDPTIVVRTEDHRQSAKPELPLIDGVSMRRLDPR